MTCRFPATLLLLLATTTATDSALADDNTRLNAIGIDVVRLLDNAQFEPDDGVINLSYQRHATRNTAWTIAYARGDRSSVWEAGFKIYNQADYAGPFWQVGFASVDVDGAGYDHELAAWGAFGIERMPAPNVVINCAAKAMVGIDHPHTGQKDIFFTPTVSVMIAF